MEFGVLYLIEWWSEATVHLIKRSSNVSWLQGS